MFAVPGWAVSGSSLTTQAFPETRKKRSSARTSAEDAPKGLRTPSKRCKQFKNQDAKSTNVAQLRDMVVAGKPVMSRNSGSSCEIGQTGRESEGGQADPSRSKEDKKQKKKRREKNFRLRGAKQAQDLDQHATESTTNIRQINTTRPVSGPYLTPLQISMRHKLISARFRYLNQTLYTAPSSHAVELFRQNPEMFDEYHEGFRRQVELWPENPITGYIEGIKAQSTQDKSLKISELQLLPRTHGLCTIADLGCGEAALARALHGDRGKLNLVVNSYDLQKSNEFVTTADIANLPIADGSVDVALFCLSLMGTNWIDFIEEAFRILRWKGELWIAEIKSRFNRNIRSDDVVLHSVVGKKSVKLSDTRRTPADEEITEAELDGSNDRVQETNIGPFVEVLRKRGFVLRNEMVDLSNTMFVKLYFTKGGTPTTGRYVPVVAGVAETWRRKPKTKYLDGDGVSDLDEASVLKPCVYKIR